MNKKILVEGWRGINHSYAMVNQYQLLEFQKRDVDLYHHDLPFYRKEWSKDVNFCGFGSGAIERIFSIPKLSDNILPEVTYRIGFPYNLTPTISKRLFVFGTSEYQTIDKEMLLLGNRNLAYKKLPVTIITPSNWSKVGFLNAGFSDEQVKVIPHGVDLSIFKPLDLDLRNRYRQLLGADKNSFVILAVGAMSKNKGIDILLSAYIQLKIKHPELKLVLKDQSNLYGFSANDLVWLYFKDRGLDPYSKQLSEVISGIIFISENLDLNQLNGLYNAADCYVSPYRAEGFNLPPLEAAAAGCPIVVTKGGSTDDYVDPSFALLIESEKKCVGGQFFLEPNLDSLIDQLSRLVYKNNPNINMDIAKSYIDKNFGWGMICDDLIKTFWV